MAFCIPKLTSHKLQVDLSSAPSCGGALRAMPQAVVKQLLLLLLKQNPMKKMGKTHEKMEKKTWTSHQTISTSHPKVSWNPIGKIQNGRHEMSEAWAPQQEILCGRISLQVQNFFCAGCCQPATLRYSQWLMLSTTCWLVHSSKSLFRLVCLKIGNPPNPMLHHRFFRNNKQFHAICRYPRMLRGSQPEEVAALSKDHLRDVLSSVSTVGG